MSEFYTDPNAAREIIGNRMADTQLNYKLAEFLGGSLPEAVVKLGEPTAVLARYVPSAREEDTAFIDIAEEAGMIPAWASYRQDQYVSANPEKTGTLRPAINFSDSDRTRSWIVAKDDRKEGQPIGEMPTIYGYSVMDYHEAIRELAMGQVSSSAYIGNTFDFSDWYKEQAIKNGWDPNSNDKASEAYYPAAMAAAAVRYALLEDFHDGPNANNGRLDTFRKNIVYPAIAQVQEELGVSPIIVRIPYQSGMGDINLRFRDKAETNTFKTKGPRAALVSQES
jgi:hypothetical protein